MSRVSAVRCNIQRPDPDKAVITEYLSLPTACCSNSPPDYETQHDGSAGRPPRAPRDDREVEALQGTARTVVGYARRGDRSIRAMVCFYFSGGKPGGQVAVVQEPRPVDIASLALFFRLLFPSARRVGPEMSGTSRGKSATRSGR